MLTGKHVLLGVTGGIAAYKTASLASMLVKLHADVHVIMTKNAQKIISPHVFEALTGNRVIDDVFDRDSGYQVAHIAMAREADIAMIAPATANIMAKLAVGIADDMLSSTMLAVTAPVYLVPAMNTHMYEHPATQANMEKLRSYGYHVAEPASGFLACGDTGKGKMPEPEELLEYILYEAAFEKDMAGKKVLVTAGPTREAIDPVRFVTNHSTGKMGYALAANAARRGAQVTLVTGPVQLRAPLAVETVPVITAREMYDAVDARFDGQDIVVMAAAVADYRPAQEAAEKIKKTEAASVLELERTDDILGSMSARKNGQLLCGFSMETENLLENSRAKLRKKNLDMIVANNLRTQGAGFGTDTNVITLITPDGAQELPLMSKDEAARAVFDKILQIMQNR
ncbi:MAG: bifunctional phosphopantothenoylcysteine decarboxylase/phosphopantothenate--cysteine ligase CoaBC [Eubacterium sp.]|jgi:phosphopantothenoylcysteine decarboxylase/phosphopantothenate--cysteine ligase|nr:bifunctional phosphopantothenoylcysteine decarboxylase/phosphopantothenate--cysteine ligase CoaBC [Eubacterium sp.]